MVREDRGHHRSLMFLFLNCASAVIGNTAEVESLLFTVSWSTDPRLHTLNIHLVFSISIHQGTLPGLLTAPEHQHSPLLKHRPLTSMTSSRRHRPWRSFQEVQSTKRTIPHLEHRVAIQIQGTPAAGQPVLGLSPCKLQAVTHGPANPTG